MKLIKISLFSKRRLIRCFENNLLSGPSTYPKTGTGFLGRWCIAALWIMVWALSVPANASLEIDITRGHLDPTPLAIPNFSGSTDPERQIGEQIAGPTHQQGRHHRLRVNGLSRCNGRILRSIPRKGIWNGNEQGLFHRLQSGTY